MNSINENIKYGKSTIDFNVSFSDRKSLSIQVYPDSSVKVLSPKDATMENIKSKVRSKARWISKHRDYFLSFYPITPPRKFISGETHLYLGKQYRLKVHQSEEERVLLKSGYIIVEVFDIEDKSKIECLMKDWYKNQAKKWFTKLFDSCLTEYPEFKEYSPKLKYRWLKKRWGSCSKDGSIILNLELIKAKKEYIQYVITHELCHLRYFDHSSSFYNLLEDKIPNWKTTKNKLEKMMV